MQLILYQPDIAPNVGTILRTTACLGIPTHVIEPCGFPWDDRKFLRAGMDYLELAMVTKHPSWDAFGEWKRDAFRSARIVLMTTRSSHSYLDTQFYNDDFIMLGRESAGVPQDIHDACDLAITIPMQTQARSLNVAISAAMVMGEVVRQQRSEGRKPTFESQAV